MKRGIAVLATVAALLGGCDIGSDLPVSSPVERLGLLETTQGRALVEEAMAAANAIVLLRSNIHLAGSWQPIVREPDISNVVTVYLLDSALMSSSYSVMVPNDCHCIFIQPAAFSLWLAAHSTEMPEMLAVEPKDALTFMLLHEVGHIVHGDPGQFEAQGQRPSYNTDKTDQKAREEAADRYAVELIEAASQDSKSMDAWMGAMAVQLALVNLSWNTAAQRFLGSFGATTLCSRSVFADAGYSHPNFELRVLMANDMLARTSTSHQLVESFQACRSNPPSPILFDNRELR